MVLALIEERAGLLPAERRDREPQAVLHDLHLLRRVAVEHARVHLQAFELSHAHVVALDDRARSQLFDEQLDEHRLDRVRPLREGLQDEHVGVSINDERGQRVAFGVNEPVSVRPARDLIPPRERRAQASAPPVAVDLFLPPTQ